MEIQRRLTKTGQLYIPKGLRQYLNFKEQMFLCIYVENNSIIIEHILDENSHNKIVYNGNKITVPVEIQRILGITKDTNLLVTPVCDFKKLVINILSC
ncbi:AbrB/MazE/SpoVT family DNA-binding domain-containing protein [Bacillus infantis]|uniref:AbrB/MazE/SpoVT family DNA-binding domain-containing protein n=1 Tax=Bacillus infantis TaxID=324767 RepID=UPI0020051F4D|nr:AbrB/MazE/SpoVT family DNA-binding domain-containing protein [Bacillus infantis]MCK6205744.1 AbrB/MazE/SpoVT family DNA-binding domain-containing protein [Bacillus infantis]